MRIFLVLAALAATASAGPIEDAREQLRKGTVELARTAVETLVAADSAEAVKALQQGVESVLGRLKSEQDALKKTSEERNRVLSKLIDLSSKSVELIAAGKHKSAEWNALQKNIDAAKAKGGKLAEEQAEARRKVTASESIGLAALLAFGRFRADGAVAAIERVAAAKSGRVSRACTVALVRIGAARSLPALADLSRAGDPTQRAMAARGLKFGDSGPPPELAACVADKAWHVRYAAYDAVTLGPMPVAIPLLIDARGTAPEEDLPRIDLCLGRLTGLAFPESTQWKAWWGANGDAVRGGTFRKTGDVLPPRPDDLCLGVASTSRRLALVLACDPPLSFEKDADGKPENTKPNLFHAVREEVKRAVAAIPDRATFSIDMAGLDSSEAKPPVRASDASRRAAGDWLDKLEERHPGPLFRFLTEFLISDPGRLKGADTVLLVSASREPLEAGTVDLLVAQLGELTEGPVVHCVAAGDSFDEYLLASVALQTGGGFAGGKTRVYAKPPAPGADRWTAGNVRVAAYRRLRAGQEEREALKSLASISEEAYPLLPMVVARLESDARLEALAVLSAMGPWAREALPRVQSLADDSSPELAKAAQAAADKIAGK